MSNRKGTYFEIDRLANKVRKLEKEMKVIKEFMNNWGPDVQRKRDERDAVWDEMVRVVSIQRKHQQPKPGYDIHGRKWQSDETNNEENH